MSTTVLSSSYHSNFNLFVKLVQGSYYFKLTKTYHFYDYFSKKKYDFL